MFFGALFGLLGVALGAFGAHGLAVHLSAQGVTPVWEKAVLYQLVHSLGLIALSGLSIGGTHLIWIRRCWVFGVIVFSGSLYILCLSGFKWMGAITPIGGIALLAGWGLLLKESLGRKSCPSAK